MYLVLLDRRERQALADRQVAAVLRVDLPTVAGELEQFNEALNSDAAPSTPADLDQYELNRALGVA